MEVARQEVSLGIDVRAGASWTAWARHRLKAVVAHMPGLYRKLSVTERDTCVENDTREHTGS